MRVLRAIVRPQPLLVTAGQAQTMERRGVGAQLVGDQQFGDEARFLSSLRISRSTARLSRRRWTSMSRTSPSWSTARHRYIRSPAIRTTISSRCQRSLGRGRRPHSRRAITGPNFSTQRRTVS